MGQRDWSTCTKLFVSCFSGIWTIWDGVSVLKAQSSWVGIRFGKWTRQNSFLLLSAEGNLWVTQVCCKGSCYLSFVAHEDCSTEESKRQTEEEPRDSVAPHHKRKAGSVLLWMSYLVFVQGISNYSLGQPSKDSPCSPNSPFRMDNLPNHRACLARTANHAIMPGLWAGAQTPGLQSPLPTYLTALMRCCHHTALAGHNWQTRKGNLVSWIPMSGCTRALPYYSTTYCLAYKDAVSPSENYQMLYKTSSLS